MKNKIDYGVAVKAAEKIKLRLDEDKYRSFPNVADFCAAVKDTCDGELRIETDSEMIRVLDITHIRRADVSDDASCFDTDRCSGDDFGGKGV